MAGGWRTGGGVVVELVDRVGLVAGAKLIKINSEEEKNKRKNKRW